MKNILLSFLKPLILLYMVFATIVFMMVALPIYGMGLLIEALIDKKS